MAKMCKADGPPEEQPATKAQGGGMIKRRRERGGGGAAAPSSPCRPGFDRDRHPAMHQRWPERARGRRRQPRMWGGSYLLRLCSAHGSSTL